MKEIFSWLRRLEQEGYIEIIRINNDDPFVIDQFGMRRILQIIKKKSTTGL